MTTTRDVRRTRPHVAEVWLNRPDVRNAFNDGVVAELAATFLALAEEPDLRAVVLAGHGKAFCAGADLNWMRAMADYDWAKLGLLPAPIARITYGPMGERAAQRYFVTAERFSAAEAHRIGFVHEVCPAGEIDAKVLGLVGALVANGPAAVKACKLLVQDLAGQPISAALREDTARRLADIRGSAEGREGVSSFLQKRPPAWI